MQLPRKVTIGENILNNTREFIKGNTIGNEKIAIITGINVKNKLNNLVEDSFIENKINYQWVIAGDASFQSVKDIEKDLKKEKIKIII